MHYYLFKNNFSLEKLSCDRIKHDLLQHKVITYEQKRVMGHQLGIKVFENIQRDLNQGKSRKFKVFLQIMEDSDVLFLQGTAKRLGK